MEHKSMQVNLGASCPVSRPRNRWLTSTLSAASLLLFFAFCLSGCSGSDDYEVFGTIRGTVTDYQTGLPLAHASVVLSPSGLSRQTDDDGTYRFDELEPQQYTITVQRSGYQSNRKTITVVSGETQQVDVQLSAIPQ